MKAGAEIESVGIIGIGQVGRLFYEELTHTGLDLHMVHRDQIPYLMRLKPQLLIVATRNPTHDVLKDVSESIMAQTTVLLPQNGVDVTDTATEILGEFDAVRLVRASLFTAVSIVDGGLHYDPFKLRMAIAPFDHSDEAATEQVEVLFSEHAFNIHRVPTERLNDMQMTKLLLNSIGSTTPVTGRTLKETFESRPGFITEVRGLKNRRRAMIRAGIRPMSFRWMNPLQRALFGPGLRFIPEDRVGERGRAAIAKMIVSQRGGQETASFRQMQQGKSLPRQNIITGPL